ncbi:Zona pellucida sperm-binding protein 3 [Pitangus sulphuratus]|nr:Zona pellucida sperm-binding protein 3 [Pitangus sulphuratus]
MFVGPCWALAMLVKIGSISQSEKDTEVQGTHGQLATELAVADATPKRQDKGQSAQGQFPSAGQRKSSSALRGRDGPSWIPVEEWSQLDPIVLLLAGMTPDSLIYKTSLSYKPTPSGNLVIVRTNPVVVPIECHYPRKSNVSSSAVRPTWAPFRSTLSAEERLMFSLRLMDDDWSAERLSNGFQLGESLHLQADVASEGHVPLRLFVDDCVATLSPDRNSSPRYAFIDLSGCLVDGRADDTTSAFISPRPRQETLQFVVDAFKFAGDNRNLIYITCHLKVSPADQAPNPWNKACSFNKASSLYPLEPESWAWASIPERTMDVIPEVTRDIGWCPTGDL